MSRGHLLFKTCVGCLLALSLLPQSILAKDLGSPAREGIESYNKEEYNPAREKFRAALRDQPENPEIAYNLGNSNYRLGRFEEAVESFGKTLETTEDPSLKQRAYYNRGNAYYRLGYLDKAIDSYRNALEIDPKDRDSKFNLEYARQQLERAEKSGNIAPRDMSQKKNNPTGPNPPKPDEKGVEDSTEENEQSVQEPDPQSPSQPQEDPPSSAGKSEPREPPPATPPPFQTQEEDTMTADALHQITSMTPEEAEQWLNSLNEDLKKFSRRQMQGDMQDVFVDNRKDW